MERSKKKKQEQASNKKRKEKEPTDAKRTKKNCKYIAHSQYFYHSVD